MALFAGPFDTANMAQANWEEVESKLWSSGVLLGARNGFAVTTTSGLGISVNTGDAIVDGFRFSNDAATPLTATTADPTNPRIDRVILRIDEAGHTGTIVIKAGTPAPSPTPPALTQTVGGTFEISLAQIRVNAGATTIASLTDERTQVTAAAVLASAVQAGTLASGVLLTAINSDAGNIQTDGAGHFTKQLNTVLPGGAGGVTHADFKQTVAAGATAGEYAIVLLHDGSLDVFDVTNNGTIMSGKLTGWTIFAPVTMSQSFNSDSAQISSDGAGNLSVLGTTGLILRNNQGSGLHGLTRFTGTGTVTATHGLNTTPNHVNVTPHVNGSQTQGYDTEGATTVHITSGSGLAWTAQAAVHV